jgi:hypothetical protein
MLAILPRGRACCQSLQRPATGAGRCPGCEDYEFGGGNSIANYDVTADGRFIMIRRGPNGGKLRVVLNWTEELKRILAAGGVE